MAQFWKVVGGKETGGILVRVDVGLKSAEASPNRVSTGAILQELTLQGQRLQFKLVEGTGPSEGWVSLKLKEMALVEKTDYKLPEAVGGGEKIPCCLMFPGQGSQYVGMLKEMKDVPAVKEMLEKSKDILGWDVLDLCLNGPEEKLAETKYTQPAMFIGGLAGREKLRAATTVTGYTGKFQHPASGNRDIDIRVELKANGQHTWTAEGQTKKIRMEQDGDKIRMMDDSTELSGKKVSSGVIKGVVIQDGSPGGKFELREILEATKAEAAESPMYVAGLSLGEYTALCAAGVFSFEDGLKLVKLRGEAMQEAAENGGKQAMLSVAGLDGKKLGELCAEAQKEEGAGATCSIANALFPNGYSCGGTEAAINLLKDKAEKAGALQAKILKTGGAFHTALMQPAQTKLNEALEQTRSKMSPPTSNIYMNATAELIPAGAPIDKIVENLQKQLTNNVMWEPSMVAMIKAGCTTYYECGPMKQLKAMMKRIDQKIWKTTENVDV